MGLLNMFSNYRKEKAEHEKERRDVERQIENERSALRKEDYRDRKVAQINSHNKQKAMYDLKTGKNLRTRIKAVNELYKDEERPRPEWAENLSEFTKANKMRTERNKEKTAMIKKILNDDKLKKRNEAFKRNNKMAVKKLVSRADMIIKKHNGKSKL